MKKGHLIALSIGVVVGLSVGYFLTYYINSRYAVQAPKITIDPDKAPEKKADIRQVEELVGQNPKSFDAQMQAAQLFNEEKNYPETLEHLTTANKLRPELFEPIVALGNAYFSISDFKKAEEWYASALSKQPNNPDVRADFGSTFLYREPPDLERAISEFRRVLESNPKHELALQNLVEALTRKGKVNEARTALLRLEQISPNNSALGALRAELEKEQRN